jgi:Fe2+ or Zn2+ uptake regulation protein
MTAPRRAILAALVESDRPDDAVALLQAACRHHPPTRIGTVYRFLRELERAGLVRAEARPPRRTRWQLAEPAAPDAARVLELRQVQDFLRELDRLGLTKTLPKTSALSAEAGLDLLTLIAERLGYRLSPNATNSLEGSP